MSGTGATPDGAPAPGGSPTRDELARAIDGEKSTLSRLEVELAGAMARLGSLRADLEAFDSRVEAPVIPKIATPLGNGPRTVADKLKLFRELFRGRSDLYPKRFVAKKTGKPGYAPVCANKFVPGVCELPKVKCGDCTKQAFV